MPSSPATTTGPAKRTDPVVTPKTTSATTTRPRPDRDPGVRRPAAVAEDRAEGVDPARRVEPPLALGLVGLAPQQRDAGDAEHHRPEQHALAEDRLERRAPRRRASAPIAMAGPALASRPTRPGRRPPRRALASPGASSAKPSSAGRNTHSAAYSRMPRPSMRREHHERDPHPQHRDGRGGAPARPRRRPRRGRRCRGRHGVRTVGLLIVSPSSQARTALPMRHDPGRTLRYDRAGTGETQGPHRWSAADAAPTLEP